MQQVTINHSEIRKWSEEHGGKPALIDYPQAQGDPIGIRLDFPGSEDETLLSNSHTSKIISWEEFFKIFDEQELAFIYETEPKGSDPTSWYRFEYRKS